MQPVTILNKMSVGYVLIGSFGNNWMKNGEAQQHPKWKMILQGKKMFDTNLIGGL